MTNEQTLPTVSANVAKLSAGVDFVALVRSIIGFPDHVIIKTRDIPVTGDLRRTGYGMRATPRSLVNALLVDMSLYAHGARLDRLTKDVPPHIQWLIETAAAEVKHGAGITAGELRTACSVALGKLASAPVRVKVEKVTSPSTPVITAPVAPDAAGNESTSQSQLATLQRVEAEHDAVWGAYGDALAKAQSECVTLLHDAQEPAPADRIRGLAHALPDDARLDILRELAAELGMRLTRIPAQRAA